MPLPLSRSRCLLLALLLISVYAVELWGFAALNPFACEDAYITYRFAENLATGQGPVFNPGERVEGYSNPVWMATISLACSAGLDMAAFSQAAGMLFSCLALLLVWYIPRRWGGCRGPSALLGPALYLLFVPFHFYAFAGLETSLYIFLVLASLAGVLWAEQRPGRLALCAGVFLLLALTRPEGIIFFGCYGLYVLWRVVRRQDRLRSYLPGIVLFVVGYGLFVSWRLWYFGLPLPNTYYAKGAFPAGIRALLGLLINKGFLQNYFFLPVYVLLLAAAAPALLRQRAVDVLLVFIAAGSLFTVAFSGFDWMPFFRYTLPVAPLLMILCSLACRAVWGGSRRRRAAAALAVCLLLACAAEQGARDLAFNLRWKQISDFAWHNQRTVGTWMRQRVGSQPVVALGDVGRLAYFSGARIMDIFGLTSREFAAIKQRYGAPDIDLAGGCVTFDSYKAHERAQLLASQPDYVLLYNARLKISDTYPGSAAGIADHPDFQQHYVYLDSFFIIPPFGSSSWPRLHHAIDTLDLSAGLLAWMRDGWGYDIYVHRDSPAPRFHFDKQADEYLRAVVADG